MTAREDRYKWVDIGVTAADTYTGKASDITRNLAFVGIGLVLVLGGVAKDTIGKKVVELSPGLLFAGSALIVCLLFDIAQYGYASAAWTRWYKAEEKRLKRDDYKPKDGFPKYLSRPTDVLFWLKILAATLAYSVLLWHLIYAFK
ncbi:MAG: hypothetical protein JWL72_798 [Ilumatobacteraceae bacterium]|nr:hypothetical protein [Ilumatobacteraceae bacterium]